MMFQMPDLTKPLAFEGRSTAKWHRTVLDDEGAYIQHKAAGKAKLRQRGMCSSCASEPRQSRLCSRTTSVWLPRLCMSRVSQGRRT